MSAFADRLLGPLRTLIRVATARVDFYALYSAVVDKDNGDETCDLTPEDSRLPSMQSIPKMYGLPAVTSAIESGTKVLVCFQNGDPSKPAIVLFGTGGASRVTLQPSSVLELAGNSDALALASQVQNDLGIIRTTFNAHVHASASPGNPTSPPATPLVALASVASSKVKAT